MDSVKDMFVVEANELLSTLEGTLLVLENDPRNKSNIEQVFRIMHTLKGNSSMFGLNTISDFVHDLETVYDKVRSGEMELSNELLSCTLSALDHLRAVIYDAQLNDAANRENHDIILKKIKTIIHKPTGNYVNVEKQKSAITYYIYFEPHRNILHEGTNPLYLVQELNALGKAEVIPHFREISDFSEFDSSECIVYWEIFLETTADKKTIQDVFVFVEGKAEIKILELPRVPLTGDINFLDQIRETVFLDKKVSDEEYFVNILNDPSLNETASDTADSLNEKIKAKNGIAEKAVSSIRVSSEKLDELMRLVSELVTTQASLTLFCENNKVLELENISENVEKLSRRLRDIAFGMTLVPINSMFGRFHRMVRDVSIGLDKDVEFVTEGGETELDKTIIETLTDPLMHLIRNCLDHGIETQPERIRHGKPAKGRLQLKAYYSGVFVYIQISDDGKGIDTQAVRAKAIDIGLLKAEDELSEKEIFDLLFYPGFSTASKITELSGRGVGMDVVKRNVTDLRGSISIASTLNQGTSFTIKLPLTLSIIDGLLVEVDGTSFIIPLSVVTKCYEVDYSAMEGNFHHLLNLDGEQIPYINLRKEFAYTSQPPGLSQIIIVGDDSVNVGISVDSIIGEYQAVVKPIGQYYRKQDFISGATILGDGTVALVLDTHKLIELYCSNVKKEENFSTAAH